jgi:hypothetical protein
MEKKFFKILAKLMLIFFVAINLSACTPAPGETISKTINNYTGSYYQGNYVWGGAMNMAWNEFADNIIGEDIEFATDDPKALEMTDKFNSHPFAKDDLDEDSYYVKSGYGQKTVDQINKESREKFPEKSFPDLNISLSDFEIISYAYFLKKVEYKTVFEESDVNFLRTKVKGFKATNNNQRKNISVLAYENEDKFIIKLQLKEHTDSLFIAKGYDMENPTELIKQINETKSYTNMSAEDTFEMPKLDLDLTRYYKELAGLSLKNSGFEDYYLQSMYENIKFSLDHEGARVENQAVMLWGGYEAAPQEPKNLILDKPFWVIMKQSDSENPYFLLGVNNENLMTKI